MGDIFLTIKNYKTIPLGKFYLVKKKKNPPLKRSGNCCWRREDCSREDLSCFSFLPGHGHSPCTSQALACLSNGGCGCKLFLCSGAQSSPPPLQTLPTWALCFCSRDSPAFQSEATAPAGVKLPNHSPFLLSSCAVEGQHSHLQGLLEALQMLPQI